jgi:hypothetical protein
MSTNADCTLPCKYWRRIPRPHRPPGYYATFLLCPGRRCGGTFTLCGLADTELSIWYQVIHDIVPSRQRLAAHRIVAAVQCVLCEGVDTLLHRLVQCVTGAVLWTWTRGRIARFLRVDHTVILDEWFLRPAYHFWPPTKTAAVTWILAQFVCYRLHTQRRQSLSDYLDFLRRTRWKYMARPRFRNNVGAYLDVLD